LSDDVSVAALLRELQETNRLLRTIVSQQTVRHEASRESLGVLPSPLVAAASNADPRLPSTPELHTARETVRGLVEALAHAAFDSAGRGHLSLFRDELVQRISRQGGSDEILTRRQVPLVLRPQDQPSQNAALKSALLWNLWYAHILPGHHPLAPQDIEELQHQWPVRFDLDSWTQSPSRDSGWILGEDPFRLGVLCGTPLVIDPDGNVLPANAILDASQAHASDVARTSSPNLVSPGSVW
jgi:hypothetical protein